MLFNTGQLFFQIRNFSVLDLRGKVQIAFALGLFQFDFGLFELCLHYGDGIDGGFFILPLHSEGLGLVLQIGELAFNSFKAFLAGDILFLGEGGAFDFELQNLPVELVQFRGFGIQFHLDTRSSLIHQVNRLVRQEPVGDVALRERGRRDQGGVLNADTMMHFVTLLKTTQDGDGGFDRRLGHEHGLKTAFERRVFLNVLAVFVQRGGAHAAEFAARELRLHDVGGIAGTFGGTGTNERVQLINEQNDFTLAGGDFLEERLEPFFKFTTILGPGNHRAQIHGHEPFVFQGFRHITAHDAAGQAFGNGGLAHARFADEDGIVFGATGEHLHDAADFLVATDDGVNLPLPGQGGEVTAVFFKGLEFSFRLLIGHPLVAAQIGEGFQYGIPLKIVGRNNLFQRRAGSIQ